MGLRLNVDETPYLVNLLNQNKYDITSGIYAEMRGKDQKYWNMALSSLVNRIGKREWADMDLPELMNKSFYAVSDTSKNKGWEHAQSGNFPDKESENKFKRILAFVNRAIAGDIELNDNQFYFTKKEEVKAAKNGNIDFKLLKKTGRVGNFNTYKYKDTSDKTFKEAFAEARKNKKKLFAWKGKKYSTQLAK